MKYLFQFNKKKFIKYIIFFTQLIIFINNSRFFLTVKPKHLIWKNEKIDVNKIKKEIMNYNKYKNISDLKVYFYKKKIPKISVIITLYNQVKFIPRIYACIQNQSFQNLEIIFIDDCSKDNPLKILKKLIERDKRIKYIKNFTNKGQFYSRNKAVLFSKGEYILIIDPDDLLLNNIIIKAYKTAKLYNLDIVHYHNMMGNFENNTLKKKKISGIFYQPKIKNIFFIVVDRYLWDKLIKKEIFIKSLNFMDEKYKNERIAIHNDDIVCFGLFRVAESYGFLEEIGYFYNRGNNESTHKINYKKQYINRRYRSIFSIMKYYYLRTDNNTYEKVMGGYNFYKLRFNKKSYKKIKFLTEGFDYIIDVLNLYINSPYYNNKQKKSLKNLKNKILQQKIKINSKRHKSFKVK